MMITIQPATPQDLPAILALLERSGLPTDGFVEQRPYTVVAHEDTVLVGSAALEIYGSDALLRSVAVDESLRGQGVGKRLTQAALDHALAAGISGIYLLTETAGDFFPRFGFAPVTRADVPAGVRQSVEFTSACPESALVMSKQLA
ncbi:MAG: arsenic resistance N-acetyltransferase ArsN2 [Chloroflexota bacterium]